MCMAAFVDNPLREQGSEVVLVCGSSIKLCMVAKEVLIFIPVFLLVWNGILQQAHRHFKEAGCEILNRTAGIPGIQQGKSTYPWFVSERVR